MKSYARKLRHYKNDPQREALYQVERGFSPKSVFGATMTLAQAERLIKKVRRQYRLLPVRLCYMPQDEEHTVDHGRCDSFFDGETDELVEVIFNINRRKKSLNAFTLLHELAHVICDQYYGAHLQDHGPEFVGVAIWLYNYYRVIPEDAFRLVLGRYKVRYRPMPESSPSALWLVKNRTY